MNYMALITGTAKECSKSIGCNKIWREFKSDSWELAAKEGVMLFNFYGGPKLVSKISIYSVNAGPLEINVEGLVERRNSYKKKTEESEKERTERELLAQLRAKYKE